MLKPEEQYAHAQSQLNILTEIQALCTKLNVRCWLRGGWAVDFLLGKITRPHEDIDLVVWARHRQRVERALKDAGYQCNPISSSQTDFRREEVDVQLCYLARGDDGRIVANGKPHWVWRADALPLKRFLLYGISSYVLSPNQLLEEKEVYKQIGRLPRAKDAESIRLLQSIMDF
ncbi:nucleotidyltransferase domain-containing protein [Paenibacillus sp. OAS669]|uniref:nucleotidyltransferase domain-containing protein n=1 Tax=Paenibacillus sp. OAS669 TaxID=2663821 RepID=UPI001789808E|nr:nucleotidyltransferase family protein [Paenibacillus sp. OAS669]MBE1442397.1 hypothetical protein [Paenibacillus sp. OAS669]